MEVDGINHRSIYSGKSDCMEVHYEHSGQKCARKNPGFFAARNFARIFFLPGILPGFLFLPGIRAFPGYWGLVYMYISIWFWNLKFLYLYFFIQIWLHSKTWGVIIWIKNFNIFTSKEFSLVTYITVRTWQQCIICWCVQLGLNFDS